MRTFEEKETFSFQDAADYLGVTLAEVIEKAREIGLIDEDGMPTEFAIKNGLLSNETTNTCFGLN
jgi:hypothetical protein